MSGECVTDKGGQLYASTSSPAPLRPCVKDGLAKAVLLPGWGLHRLDYSVPQGDLIDDVVASSATWEKARKL